MSDELLERHGIDPHPIQGRASRFSILGTLAIAGGSWLLLFEANATGIAPLGFGALLLFLARELRSAGATIPAVNRAVQQARAGHIDNAIELLDYVEEQSDNAYVLRAVAQQRAQLACRRGDLDAVVRHTTAVLDRNPTWRAGIQGRIQTPHALGLRAFALASVDRHDEAARDIAAVREHPSATAEALADAELAQAVSLERRGERDALRAHLAREQELLSEHTQPRARELVRALERMLSAKTQSVYRKAAKPEGHEIGVEDWVATIAPEAAGFARGHGDEPLVDDPSEARADASAKKAAAGNVEALTKGKGAKPWLKIALLWFLLILVFLLVWALLAPGGAGGSEPVDRDVSSALVTGLPMLLLAIFAAVFIALISRARSLPRRLIQASSKLARGHRDEALAELDELTRCSQALTAASAYDLLAKWEARKGRVDEALAQVDAGLGRINTPQFRALASDHLLPSLLALRAWCLAARGDDRPAEDTLTTLRTSFRAYPDLDAATLRVRSIQAARAGDVGRLADLSEARAELGLSPRDEILLDLGRAAVAPGSAGAGEIARLRKVVQGRGEIVEWVERLAPALIPAFQAVVRPEA